MAENLDSRTYRNFRYSWIRIFSNILTIFESAFRPTISFSSSIARYIIPVLLYTIVVVPFLVPKAAVYVYVISILYLAIRPSDMPTSYLSCLSAYLLLAAVTGVPLLKDSLIRMAIGIEKLSGFDIVISPTLLLSGSAVILAISGLFVNANIAAI